MSTPAAFTSAAADRLLDTIIRFASRELTASGRNGEPEIAVWKQGVTL